LMSQAVLQPSPQGAAATLSMVTYILRLIARVPVPFHIAGPCIALELVASAWATCKYQLDWCSLIHARASPLRASLSV
jgi:hypothetical protein